MNIRLLLKTTLAGLSLAALLVLNSCSTPRGSTRADGPPAKDVDVSRIPDAVPHAESTSKYGNPSTYVVHGVRYHVLKSAKGYDQVGLASWYGTKFHGQLTSSREPYNMYGMTAASCTLPIPTYVRVTNLRNGKSVIVKVNDRGPFKSHRLLDLSYAAAKKLGYVGQGTTKVRVTAIDATTWAKNQKSPTPKPKAVLANAKPRPNSTHLAANNAYLQVGAFTDLQHAQQLKQQVQHLTHAPVAIHTGQHQHTPIYRVQIGPLPQAEFAMLRRRLQDHGIGQASEIS